MEKSRTPFYILIGLLVVVGLGLSFHRHLKSDVPWLPGEKRQVWSIEAKIDFVARGEPVKLSFAIPDTQPGFERLAEYTASPGYGLAFIDTPTGRRAEWSIRQASGSQTLYYRVDMLEREESREQRTATPPVVRSMLSGDGPHVTAARQLLQSARDRSADSYTLTRELIQEFNNQAQSAQFLEQRQSRAKWLVELLQEAGVPVREVFVLSLEDGRRRQQLQSYLQVFLGDAYQLFDIDSGHQGLSDNQILWEYQSGSLLDLIGGRKSSVYFSVIEQETPATRMTQLQQNDDSALLDFSIHSLPVQEQTVFKGILLIPVGVLVVVFLRIMVGLKTSGTFMPVLIAMAFIQTSLVPGLIGFLVIVGIGLLFRSYLSQLNLLLVARISAVIITVIVMIAVFSVIAYQIGLSEGLKITFFPMIILSWTIERMSILWEEEGPKDVFIQGGGSLLVAVIAYAFMTNEIIRHLTFNFLGLQLVVMALVLILGNYTGYRLLEIRRFRPLIKD